MNEFKEFLPKVDFLIERAKGFNLKNVSINTIKKTIVLMLEEQRNLIRRGVFKKEDDLFSEENFKKNFEIFLKKVIQPPMKRVINATGTVIHTNLGRAPLSEKLIEEIKPLICNYSDLEFDLNTGLRGSRLKHIKQELFSGEDILVVNNNASACLLILNTIAYGREVIVSRGELVEIGGSFRIPEIMKSSGAILKEVGTTNKTRLKDYETAINENTALILKVHKSNFVVKGFVEEVSTDYLVDLSKKYNIPLYFDAGSGAISIIKNISSEEPIINDEIKKGVDIISFSGDKLLGGTQAGIIVGRKNFIENMKKNPLYRALRPDKFTIYYLERLFHYLLLENYEYSPVISMLLEKPESIKRRAKKVLKSINGKIDKNYFKLTNDYSTPGGGSLPEVTLETYVLKIKHPVLTEEEISKFFLSQNPPVITRRKEGNCIIDFRTIKDEDIPVLSEFLINLFSHE